MKPKDCVSCTTHLRKIKAFMISLEQARLVKLSCITFDSVIELNCALVDFEKIIDMREDKNNLLTNV